MKTTCKTKSEVPVFKDMNAMNVSKQIKKNVRKTEAFGDKENQTDKCQSLRVIDSSKSEAVEPSEDKIKRLITEPQNEKKRMAENVTCGERSGISVDDLTTTDEPSEQYWKTLAEQQREALKETLQENKILNQKVELLLEENETLKQALQQATDVIDLLNEIVNEKQGETTETDGREDVDDSLKEEDDGPNKSSFIDESDSD